jgi:nucleotide-binding universal stress UspA family protein
MIREIFVPVLGASGDTAALDAAAALAVANQAHVSAMVALTHPLPVVSEMGMIVVEPDTRQLDAMRAAARERAERAGARLAREALASEVRVTECFSIWAEEAAAVQAIHCDLSVLGNPVSDADSELYFSRVFRGLLLGSGRPVLVVPEGATLPVPVSRVVLAWKPTPEATRALHDALPLLSPSAEIDVLVIDPLATETGYGEQPGADIARLLARHGYQARVLERSREGGTTARCLLRHVEECGAQLLVMGGYGHWHWRERVLGGATRDVLDTARIPVLFSH